MPSLPDALDEEAHQVLADLWAKSPLPCAITGELLTEHTGRVLGKLADLRRLRPGLPLHVSEPRLWHYLASACLIHDFGKAADGFQQQVRLGGQPWRQRHEVLSLAFLDWVCPDADAQRWVAAAVVSHHRDAAVIQDSYPSQVTYGDDPVTAMVDSLPLSRVRALANWVDAQRLEWQRTFGDDAVCRWQPWSDVTTLDRLRFKERAVQNIRTALRLYRRLCRDLDAVDAANNLTDLAMTVRGSIIASDRLGSAHANPLRATGLGSGQPLVDRLGLSSLRSHQRDCAGTSGSVILRAPTGSGKTEASLLWAERQAAERGSAPRLFYVLPFQASMNAMFRRLARAFPEEFIGLQHSRALHAIYRTLLETDETPYVASKKARLERRLAGLNFHPVRVLSPYQLLKACYRLKGYEALLADTHGGLFIFDEVHAYEPKRLAMISSFIQYLAQHYEASFCVLSATMPPVVREQLEKSLPHCTNVQATGSVYRQFRRHRLQLLDGDLRMPEAMTRVVNTARTGQSVLVCCNTVRRAQETFDELSRLLGPSSQALKLLHGGFNARDRLAKERLVLQAADASRPREPVVLVATQVVEVSLDVSFATIFSDPAPLEALVQRFGRVNRRPSGRIADVHVFTEPDDGHGIYDRAMMRSTLTALQQHDGETIDEGSIDNWLETVYTEEIEGAWRKDFQEAEHVFRVGCLDSLRPFASSDELEDLFYAAFDAIDVLPKSLEREYEALTTDNPIEADQLLVSIRHTQFGRLLSQGRVQRRAAPEQWPPVIDASYDSTLGLRLNIAVGDQP